MTNPLDLVNKFAAREKDLVGKNIFAPIVKGAGVRVRVGGVILELRVDKRDFEGWAILRVKDLKTAEFVDAPSLKQTAEYLQLFPRLRMVLIGEFDDVWWGLMFNPSDKRFKISGPVPIRLVKDGKKFSTVAVRCDGANFWYETYAQRNYSIAVHLNSCLENRVAPEELRYPELVPAERLAYLMAFLRTDPEYVPGKRGTIDEKIRFALQHAGAKLDAFWLQDDESLTVRFTIDGNVHVCRVRNDLSLQSAGICLSGQDRQFDLTSLVGVLQQANRNDWDEH
jgi:hypothetical protein